MSVKPSRRSDRSLPFKAPSLVIEGNNCSKY
jgi:hypothetical protein